MERGFRMRRLSLLVALGTLAPLALGACGGGGSSSSSSTPTTTAAGGGGGGGETVKVSAVSGQLAFQQKSLSAKSGSDTFDFTNPDSAIGHDFCIKDQTGSEVGCTDIVTGSSANVTVDLQPGKYTYYCSVDGHEASGMEGTLTVK
jgi:plastocyanin